MTNPWFRHFVVVIGATLASAALAAPTYRVEDLGPVPGGTGECYATGISQNGTVVGSSTLTAGRHPKVTATMWKPSGSAIDIGYVEPGDTGSIGRAVNSSGQVAGISGARKVENPFLWSEADGMLALGHLSPTQARTGAQAINDLGHAAGYSQVAKGHLHAFYWSPESGIVDIGVLSTSPKTNHSVAFGMNDLGEVVGISLDDKWRYVAFRWSLATGIQNMGAMSKTSSNFAMAINAKGKIVGYDIGPLFTAYILTPGHKMRALASVPGQTYSMAFSINSSDVVVGRLQIGTATFGTIWETPDTVSVLDDQVDPADPLKGAVTIQEAISINDAGQIAANGMIGGLQRALRLTPHP